MDYGIEANALALRSTVAAAPQVGPVPNLGYFAIATLNVPVGIGARLQASCARLSTVGSKPYLNYPKPSAKLWAICTPSITSPQSFESEAGTLREAADLAADSLRLTGLRYQAGEATALEVVDAQNVLTVARKAFDDGRPVTARLSPCSRH